MMERIEALLRLDHSFDRIFQIDFGEEPLQEHVSRHLVLRTKPLGVAYLQERIISIFDVVIKGLYSLGLSSQSKFSVYVKELSIQ